MSLPEALDLLQAGNAHQIDHLVHGDGVVDIGLHPCLTGNVQRDRRSKIGGMVIHRPVPQDLYHGIVDLVSSGADPPQQSAAADYGAEGIDRLPLIRNGFQNQLRTHFQLVIDHGIGLDLRGIVLNIFSPLLLFSAVPGNFRGGRTRVNDQNVIHFLHLFFDKQNTHTARSSQTSGMGTFRRLGRGGSDPLPGAVKFSGCGRSPGPFQMPGGSAAAALPSWQACAQWCSKQSQARSLRYSRRKRPA